jgi:hypothetical protein
MWSTLDALHSDTRIPRDENDKRKPSMFDSLEADFEAQLEELNERLDQCLQPQRSEDSLITQGILRELIAGYQEELSALRLRKAC